MAKFLRPLDSLEILDQQIDIPNLINLRRLQRKLFRIGKRKRVTPCTSEQKTLGILVINGTAKGSNRLHAFYSVTHKQPKGFKTTWRHDEIVSERGRPATREAQSKRTREYRQKHLCRSIATNNKPIVLLLPQPNEAVTTEQVNTSFVHNTTSSCIYCRITDNPWIMKCN